MNSRIPPQLGPLLSDFVAGLRSVSPGKLYGLYLYNSVALGAYDERKSDIDFVAVLNGEYSRDETAELRKLHRQLLRRHPDARKLEGLYIQKEDLGKVSPENRPHPRYAQKRLRERGMGDVNHVTWWTLAYRGLPVDSPGIDTLNLHVDRGSLAETMAYNLNQYWKSKLDRKLIFLFDEWIEFGVLTVCRILYTLRFGCVVSKTEAAENQRDLLPPQHRQIVEEALRIRRRAAGKPLFKSRFQREKAAKSLIAYAIASNVRQ